MKNRGKKTFTNYTSPLSSGLGSDYDCSHVNIRTKLSNIQVAFDKVNEGQLLPIKKIEPNILAVLNHDKEICGYISTTVNKKLLDCIENGFTYWAKVISKFGDINIEN
ncbi:MAG: hypothetical protein EOO43_05180 [Flavobacterium sp.]|nr:MAG: hypothetical protein EOO43_05180 [Flavobacterium sp.]